MQIRAATLDDVERLAAAMGRCWLGHVHVLRSAADDQPENGWLHDEDDPSED